MYSFNVRQIQRQSHPILYQPGIGVMESWNLPPFVNTNFQHQNHITTHQQVFMTPAMPQTDQIRFGIQHETEPNYNSYCSMCSPFNQPIIQPVGLSPVFQSPFGELAGLVKSLSTPTFEDIKKCPEEEEEEENKLSSEINNYECDPTIKTVSSQTTCESYLNNKYSIFQIPSVCMNFDVGMFKIQGEKCPIYPQTFISKVETNLGSQCIVRVKMDRNNPKQYNCYFQAKQPGIYLASVRPNYIGSQDIEGSPFQIRVSRNYIDDGPCSSQTILKMDESTPTKASSWGICTDVFTNMIYIADRKLHKIHVYNEYGEPQYNFGGKGSNPGQFHRPTSIVFDRANLRLIISDKDNHRICIHTLDGKFITSFGQFGIENGNLRYPWGVGVSPNGTIIAVVDSRNRRIQLFDNNGNYLRKFNLFENKFFKKRIFQYPRGICFNETGTCIYVTDFNIHILNKFNLELTEKTIIVGPGILNRPQGLCVDPIGNIILCDSRNHWIRVFAPDGKLLSTISKLDSSGFHLPLDIAMMSSGRFVFIDDKGVVRIH